LKASQYLKSNTIYISRDPWNLNRGTIFIKPGAIYMFFCAHQMIRQTLYYINFGRWLNFLIGAFLSPSGIIIISVNRLFTSVIISQMVSQ
jgi:hypothetical protein